MPFIDLAAKRRTVRQFAVDALPLEQIETVLQAGLLAPSPNDSKPWKILVITNRDLLQQMKKAVHERLEQLFPNVEPELQGRLQKVKTFSAIFADAPVVFAILAKPYEAMIDELLIGTEITHDQINAWRNYPDIQSVGAVVQNMLLAATEMAVGSVWVSGALVASQALEALLKTDEFRLQALVAMGKPLTKPPSKPMPNLDDLVDFRE